MPHTRVRLPKRLKPGTFRVSSPGLLNGDVLPGRFSKGGGNFSPPLSWADLPPETASLAVTCEDPDGPRGPFTLWILFNIPPSLPGIPEGLSQVPVPPELPGAMQGANDTGTIGYEGPAPPRGHPAHRYVFRIYALDGMLRLAPAAGRSAFEAAILGHELAVETLVGKFSR